MTGAKADIDQAAATNRDFMSTRSRKSGARISERRIADRFSDALFEFLDAYQHGGASQEHRTAVTRAFDRTKAAQLSDVLYRKAVDRALVRAKIISEESKS